MSLRCWLPPAAAETAHRQRHRRDRLPGGEHAVLPRHDRLAVPAHVHRRAAARGQHRADALQGERAPEPESESSVC